MPSTRTVRPTWEGVPMAATVTATTTQADLDRLAAHYDIRDAAEVAAFLRDNPEVVGPLLEAVEVAPRYFGADAPSLIVERAREADGRPELVALIRTDLDVDASLAALRRLDEDWGLDALRRSNLKLVFGLESA